MTATKTIKIEPDVHRKLTALVSWGDTLSNVIDMLIDEHNNKTRGVNVKERSRGNG